MATLKGGLLNENTTWVTVQAATRLVAVPNTDIRIQIGTVTGIHAEKFSPPLKVGLAPAPMSPEDRFETFVDVFMTVIRWVCQIPLR